MPILYHIWYGMRCNLILRCHFMLTLHPGQAIEFIHIKCIHIMSFLSKNKLLVLVSNHLSLLKNEHILAGELSTVRIGAKRYYNDRVKNTASCKSKEDIFLDRFVKCIHFVHTELRDNHYNEYRLSDGEIYDIQDSVFCKEYTISPMRLVSRIEQTQEYKHDYFETEGSLYNIPDVNKDNYIIRRFPVEILINTLPMSFYDIVSPNNLNSDERTHYIKSSIQDNIVIAAFITALIIYLGESAYFRKTSYENYHATCDEVHDEYIKWKSIERSFIFQLKPLKWFYPRSRLIDKIAPFVNSEKYLMSIIHSIVNLPILDEAGNDYSPMSGSPFIPLLDDILFNIFLDDIDQKIEDHLPDVQFSRFLSEIIVPITYDKYKEEKDIKILEEILKGLMNESFLRPVQLRRTEEI